MQETIKSTLLTTANSNEFLMKYVELVDDALNQLRVKKPKTDPNYVYYEYHHILPRCLFPDFKDVAENIVTLTAREHFMAHYYLTKIFDSRALDFAYWRLCTDGRGRMITAEEYELGKLLAVQRSSELNSGKKRTAEQRQKISERLTGRACQEKTKQKMSNSHLGYRHTEEAKQKMSSSRKGKPGRKWTDEQRKSLSDKKKGKVVGKNVKDYMTPEKYELYRQHLSDSLKGHEVSEETKQKIREKTVARGDFVNGANPKAKKIRCIEDNIVFGTLKECAQYYDIPRYLMTEIAKNGYYEKIDKHFKVE